MKNRKLLAVVSIMAVMVIGLTSVAYAVNFKTPAEIVAGLTKKTTEEVIANRQKGESYGEQAKDAGQLEAFKTEAQAQLKARLAELVKDGTLTQKEADDRFAAMSDRMETCVGDGSAMGNGGNGLRDGSGAGQGMRGGNGTRSGRGGMARGGNGLRDGSGLATKTSA